MPPAVLCGLLLFHVLKDNITHLCPGGTVLCTLPNTFVSRAIFSISCGFPSGESEDMAVGSCSPCSVTALCRICYRPRREATTYLHNLHNQNRPSFLPEHWCSHLGCAQGRERHPLDFLFNTFFNLQAGLETVWYVKRDGGATLSSKCGFTRREKREITANKEQIC